MTDDTHPFISYAHADQEWVRVLAENLHQSGVDLFYDEWEIGAGDVLVHKLDQGILNTRNGVIVVSPTALSRPWVQEEYAAMMTRAVTGKQRIIPVLLKDAELPPFLASRVHVDFRNVDGPVYLQRIEELVRALKGERRGPPPRDGGPLKPRPGTGFVAEGKLTGRLTIGTEETVLKGGSGEVRGPIAGIDPGLEQLLWEQQHAYRRPGGLIVRDGEGRGIGPVLDQLGQKLGAAFLPKEVAGRLEAEIDEAVRRNATLELALDPADGLADLPWEGLRLPGVIGQPLALHPRIDLYRHVTLKGPGLAVSIPGPLRILVAIGSPEANNARGELLDMEKELRVILDAIEPARRSDRAMVRVLERGSVEAIGNALKQQRYHVLYISCHAAPGRLMLENADGAKDEVTVARFWEEALPADRGVPLVVLAGCSTARSELPDKGDEKTEPLPGFARGLVALGVPAVIAMQAPVTDAYATALAGELFEALATWQNPEPLRALAHARRELERRRIADTSLKPPEWPTPAFYASGTPLPLYDPTAPFEKLTPIPEPPRMKGVVVRQVGDFVGRRREERLMLKDLRAANGAGVLLHGIGGVGKSSLAANVLHRLAMDGWLLASWSGEADCDQVLDQIGRRLFDLSLSQGWDEQHPLRQLSTIVREPKMAWDERLDLLGQHVFAQLPMVFLLDNFEDNLDDERQVRGDLADMLAQWIEQLGKSRLLFTCRHPFQLPHDAAARLDELHLGPLSPAETRKLMLRLPGLGVLQPEEFQRAYEEVGGHPRALEYLDALLRGGEARFKDVEIRLRKALQARGVSDASKWRADTAGGLDEALAETAALAAADVLLDELLRQLKAAAPLAKKLLFAAAVYRVPVDRAGLAFQVGNITERPDDPGRQQRMERINRAYDKARAAGKKVNFRSEAVAMAAETLGVSETELVQFWQDWQEVEKPAVEEPEGFDKAIALLASLSLLSTVQYTDDDDALHYFVHRWTARTLVKQASADEVADAHRRAARYWPWREAPHLDVSDLLEERYHHYAAGDTDRAIRLSQLLGEQLLEWGAWQRSERLFQEALSWAPQDSRKAATCYARLGILSFQRGDYDRALEMQGKALDISERLGDRTGIANSYHELGIVAFERGDYGGALDLHRKALEIQEAMGDHQGMAHSYSELGNAALLQEDLDNAWKWYHQASDLFQSFGDPSNIATTRFQLANVAMLRGDYDQALDLCREALEMRKKLGSRAGIAESLHQLSDIARRRGDYGQALDSSRKSLEIFEELGHRAGMAKSRGLIEILLAQQGETGAAVPIAKARGLANRLKRWLGRTWRWTRLQRRSISRPGRTARPSERRW